MDIAEKPAKNWYDKSYRLLFLIPIIVLIISAFYLFNFQKQHGDIIYKDVTLTGGTIVTVFDSSFTLDEVKSALIDQFPDIKLRTLSDFRTNEQRGFILETKAEVNEIKPAIEDFLGYSLTQENSSIQFSGEILSQGFYYQLKNSIIAAFLLMGWVVFLIFGSSRKIKGITLMLTSLGLALALSQLSMIKFVSVTGILAGLIFALFHKDKKKNFLLPLVIAVISLFILFSFASQILLIIVSLALIGLYGFYSIPSIAVILAALSDIIMTIAVVDYIGMSLSTAGIIAFLLLIGYSVDTDILLTTRIIKKREGTVNERLFGAFKTGVTMTLTSIVAVAVALFIIKGSSDILEQIFTILLIGLGFDLFNTWFANDSILKWYAERGERAL